MVYLTERNLYNEKIDEDNDDKYENKTRVYNPLYNINLNEIKKGLLSYLKPPFNIQGKGHEFLTKNDNSIGPGAYNIKNDLLKPQLSSNSHLYFLSKCPRFNSYNQDINVNPGPGSYNINFLKKNKAITKRGKYKSFLNYHSCSENQITTIPSKNQQFGYLENKKGELIRVTDPLYEDCFSGEKTDCVGPDRYHIYKKEKNPIVNWDRMSSRKTSITYEPTNITNKYTNISQDTSKNNQMDGDTSKKGKGKKGVKLFNMKDLIGIFRRKLSSYHYHSIKKEKKDEPSQEEIKKELESYKEEDYDTKKILYPYNFIENKCKVNQNEFQCFGSSSQRKNNIIPNMEQTMVPGPGAYFNDTFKSLKLKKIKKINQTFSKSKRIFSSINKDNNSPVGPGSYNIITKIIKRKSFNRWGSFSCEKRFPYCSSDGASFINKNEKSPGPGDYNPVDTWNKNNLANKRYPFTNVAKEIKKHYKKKYRENKADFNTYQNSQMINIIQSKINSKLNPISSVKSPFMSGNERFKDIKQFSTNRNLGPGCYELTQKIGTCLRKKKYQIPFNSNTSKISNYFNNSNSFLSPGEYQKENYFDWNKKSFNVMYI